MNITIRTNHVPRPVLARWELTEKEAKEFDYLAPDEGNFFRFKGEVYDLGEFMRIIAPGSVIRHPMECSHEAFQGWDGYLSDSFFHGLLIKYVEDDWEMVVVAEYFT